jgi:hypothetical protein
MRRTAALISLLAATPACTMTRSTSNTVMAVGAAIAAGGVVVTSDSLDAEFHGSDDQGDRSDNGGLGFLMMVTGIAIFAGGWSADEPWSEPVPDAVANDPYVTRPSGGTAPGEPDLPSIPTTDDVVRLAQQVQSAAQRNECEAAWRTVAMIDQRDSNYGALLAAGPVMRPCPRVR